MERVPGITWLFLDMNSYFASVEQQENPNLRGKPVAVIPLETDYTCAIAVSYEARMYGVRTGMRIHDAKKLCPHLRCVLAKHDKYVDYHHKVIDEVSKYIPINKIWSIDELSSKLPPSKRNLQDAQTVASKIKVGLYKNIGPAIRCSIGLAPNSLLAKIASNMKKPDGLITLPQETLPHSLLTLSLTDIPGIGDQMRNRLYNAHIFSVQDFLALSPKHARKIWGSVQGERMWYWLHGYDFETSPTNVSMIGHSRVLDPQLRSPEKSRLMARKLLMKATYRLRSHKLYANRISLSLRTTDNFRWFGELHITQSNDFFSFMQNLDILWQDMSQHFSIPFSAPTEVRFRKISITLQGLRPYHQTSQDLFDYKTDKADLSSKNTALADALDKLQRRYKKEVVSLGVPPKTLSGYVGTKIAFSRVPEREEFWS